MTPDTTYSGTITQAGFDVYDFNVTSSSAETVYFSTTGGTGDTTWVYVVYPDGSYRASGSTTGSSSIPFNGGLSPQGEYHLLVFQGNNTSNTADSYTVKVSGAGVGRDRRAQQRPGLRGGELRADRPQ